jgi:hypothetical protein
MEKTTNNDYCCEDGTIRIALTMKIVIEYKSIVVIIIGNLLNCVGVITNASNDIQLVNDSEVLQ